MRLLLQPAEYGLSDRVAQLCKKIWRSRDWAAYAIQPIYIKAILILDTPLGGLHLLHQFGTVN